MTLVVAEGTLAGDILDATFPVWHDGLTRRAYGQWNLAQQRTAWGRDHLTRVALVDAQGRLLSSAKRYRHRVRLGDRDGTLCGIGALFTPPARRGQGHATRLVDALIAEERARGAIAAALFSEIGTSFYERLGFQTVPIEELTIRVRDGAGAPAMLVRSGDARDLPAIAAMHEARSAGGTLALRRSPAFVEHVLSRRRLFAGLSPPGRRQVEFHVAEEGASAVAYVVITASVHGWTIEEAGDRDPAGARLGAMLQVLLAREPSARQPTIRTWWPAAFPLPPQVALVERATPRTPFMARPLVDAVIPTRRDEVFYWHNDIF